MTTPPLPERIELHRERSGGAPKTAALKTATALSPTVEMLTRKGTADGTCGGQNVEGTDIWGVSIYVKDGDAWKFAFGMSLAAM